MLARIESGSVAHPAEVAGRTLRAEPVHIVGPEEFRARIETEVARHARYLGGVGLLRIAPTHGREGAAALKEAVETETRRTDAVCAYPDGSHAVLLVQAGGRALEAVTQRLGDAAREIATESGAAAPEFVTGAAVADDRRVSADELWLAASDAVDQALQTSEALVFGRLH